MGLVFRVTRYGLRVVKGKQVLNDLNSEFGTWNAELKNSSKAISITMIYSHCKTPTQFQTTASHWQKLDPRLLFPFMMGCAIFYKNVLFVFYIDRFVTPIVRTR